VIKIRYSDLPGGLHVRVDARGRNTILYLLPGLTAAQRTAAIRRARSAARVGHGPGLPALGVARALAADRIRTTVRNGLAAMRMHPVIFFPPMITLVAAAAAYLLLVSVSVRLIPPHSTVPRVAVGISHGDHGGTGGSRAGAGGGPPGGAAPGSSPGWPSGSSLGPGTGQSAPPGPASARSPAPSRTPSTPGGSGSPSPAPPGTATPGLAPSSPPSPGSGSGPGGGGVCVKIGPLGVCVGL
jgi:hypothetical protein